MNRFRWKEWTACLAVVAFALLRLAHRDLLWSDEDYHLAAALNILHGKIPYRDFWYDKPPLDAFYYLLIGAHWGWALRVLDAVYVCLACWLAFRLARDLWSEIEGFVAAVLLAFFLAFYLPAAVIPFAADALLIVPQLAAILCVQRRCFVWSGVWGGVGFLVNAKSLFVLATCAAWAATDAGWVVFGFAVPVIVQCSVLVALGAWSGYVTQIWQWGLVYTRSSPAVDVVTNGARRVLDWTGFHAPLIVGAAASRIRNWRLWMWLAISFAAVCLGGRFMPRYFLQLLPALCVIGSRGFVMVWRKNARTAALAWGILLLIPAVRFGPRYVQLAIDPRPHWADVQLDEDSWAVAEGLAQRRHSGDTLFVWGYRPDIYVYVRLTPPGLFWDSQPLTGVPADRHLTASAPVYGPEAARNRSATCTHSPNLYRGRSWPAEPPPVA